jgi:hypothetical protein
MINEMAAWWKTTRLVARQPVKMVRTVYMGSRALKKSRVRSGWMAAVVVCYPVPPLFWLVQRCNPALLGFKCLRLLVEMDEARLYCRRWLARIYGRD